MSDRHLAPYDLERLQRNEIDPALAAAARGHLARCDDCRAIDRQLREHHLEFERSVLPRLAPRLRERLERPAGRSRRWVWALAAAVPAILVLALSLNRSSLKGPGDSDLLTKGGGDMVVFRRRGDSVRALVPGEKLSAGDALRFRLAPGDHAYAMVASVDAAGKATIYVPLGGDASAPVPQGGAWEAPGSVTLDDTVGPERLFALFSRKPIAAATVIGALEAVGRGGADAIRKVDHLDVGADSQASVLFEKEPR